MFDREQKFVITDIGSFAIFSKTTNHSDMGRILEGKPVSAGFCKLQRNDETDAGVDVLCYGRSVSLGISARGEEDAVFFRTKLNNTV